MLYFPGKSQFLLSYITGIHLLSAVVGAEDSGNRQKTHHEDSINKVVKMSKTVEL